MTRIAVINGEAGWEALLPNCDVVRHRIQTCRWAVRGGRLFIFDRDEGGPVDGVLWRVGAIRPEPHHQTALEAIALAGTPCVNRAAVLIRSADRLAMLRACREAGLRMLPFDVFSDTDLFGRSTDLGFGFPFVLKVGNLHGGFGKVLVRDADIWPELRDLAFAANTYATIEPYVPHSRDVRCLLIGERLWAMERRGEGFRANVDTRKARIIDVPEELGAATRRLATSLGAELMAIDALETEKGFVVLESNETPGLTGFPESTRESVADLLLKALNTQKATPAPSNGSR